LQNERKALQIAHEVKLGLAMAHSHKHIRIIRSAGIQVIVKISKNHFAKRSLFSDRPSGSCRRKQNQRLEQCAKSDLSLKDINKLK
jgi:hypothetical protein